MQILNSLEQSSDKRFFAEKVCKLIKKQKSENGGRQKHLSKPGEELR